MQEILSMLFFTPWQPIKDAHVIFQSFCSDNSLKHLQKVCFTIAKFNDIF